MPSCQVSLVFNDSGEPLILQDVDLIRRIPIILRTIEAQTPEWETQDVVVEDPLKITDFNKNTMQFLCDNLTRYETPDTVENATVEETYKEIGDKSLSELKELIELANFLECDEFMEIVGFVISKKLESQTINEVADFLGLELNRNGQFFNEADGWLHPPEASENSP